MNTSDRDQADRVNHFDQAAATWDDKPERVAVMKTLSEAILRNAQPSPETDVFDYGCGTGLVSLFLLPHVRSVTGADNSPGMLEVLRRKIAESSLENMKVVQLDLQHDDVPADRYHLIVTSMAMHHIADTDRVLRAFHTLLHPGGTLCITDLDTEPGIFHDPKSAESVYHHGFDRDELARQLKAIGFAQVDATTAHVLRRPVADGSEHDFSLFLITARCS